jgi:moderate conductance mechanosensitive channel
MKRFKERPKKEKVKLILIGVLIFLFLFLGMFAGVLFPDTTFAIIIDNSIGKFFNVIQFFRNNYVIILESLAVVVFVWILNKLLLLMVHLFTKKGHRSETIGNLLKSFIGYLSVLIALFLILSAWGVQAQTLLAGAGILGLAISFGAQSLIEDIFCGVFIVFEKQFSVGDIILVNNVRGTVLEIGTRITKVEDHHGDILMINNSDIRGAINMSSMLSPAICDISVSYEAKLEVVETIILANLEHIKNCIPEIAEGPYYLGVQSLAESSLVLRVLAKTYEGNRFKVTRALNREMKLLFDKNQVEIPFPQLVVHQKEKVKK